MTDLPYDTFIHLQPRGRHHSISQGRTVLTTELDGSIQSRGDQGLWVYQTRMLSRYHWQVNGKSPKLSALSLIAQHNDMAYYIFTPPECTLNGSSCDPAQHSVELRIERAVGEGLLEQVTLTNFTASNFLSAAAARGCRFRRSFGNLWATQAKRPLTRYLESAKRRTSLNLRLQNPSQI